MRPQVLFPNRLRFSGFPNKNKIKLMNLGTFLKQFITLQINFTMHNYYLRNILTVLLPYSTLLYFNLVYRYETAPIQLQIMTSLH
jgi:hypothetical protein